MRNCPLNKRYEPNLTFPNQQIYIWEYHWETAIDELWLTILWYEAEREAKLLNEKVSYREITVPFWEIEKMQLAKYRAAEERWRIEDGICQ